MSEDNKFKFISVDDDDDEIVIQAGVRQEPDIQTSQMEDFAQNETFSVEEAEVECANDDECEQEESQEDIERARHERERARRAAQAQANRMITTEEDLKTKAPFASMRRGIIIAAIIILVVAWLYFNFH